MTGDSKKDKTKNSCSSTLDQHVSQWVSGVSTLTYLCKDIDKNMSPWYWVTKSSEKKEKMMHLSKDKCANL